MAMPGFLPIMIIVLSILFIIAYLVGNDARKFGQNPILWGLIALIGNGIGIIAYVVMRSQWQRDTRLMQSMKELTDSQKVVAAVAKGKFIYCSKCGTPNDIGSRFCKQCAAPLQT